jgi:DNA mismatch repair protein MutS
MMRQYLEMKEEVPECILMFRMGDFYEMFMEDARLASQVLGIALTSRDKSSENPVPMCGVPHHALNQYLALLVEAGFKVAICDQVEDPSQAKGLVKRQITRVISPGMYTDPERISPHENRYLAAVCFQEQEVGLACLDLSSGEFMAATLPDRLSLGFELARLEPWEIILPQEQNKHPFNGYLGEMAALPRTLTSLPDQAEARQILGVLLHEMDPDEKIPGLISAAMLWATVVRAQRLIPEHVKTLNFYKPEGYLTLDNNTLRNLEIFRALLGGRRGSLLAAIDKTHTAMGARMLKDWLSLPLRTRRLIEARQQAVAELASDLTGLDSLAALLRQLPDLPRLLGRVGMAQAGPRDLAALRAGLEMLPEFIQALRACRAPLLREILPLLDGLGDITSLLRRTLTADPPLSLSEGGAIANGINSRLDKLRHLVSQGRNWVSELQRDLRQQTGIASLKVGFNKVFGYYIEISKTHQAKAPKNFIRKQTLAGGERYITMELKEKESAILSAEEDALALENTVFQDLRQKVAARSAGLMLCGRALARLDVLASLARLAVDKAYSRPLIGEEGTLLHISGGRHPVVEEMLPAGEFVPNDVTLDNEQQMLIITGPNMAGKSTILRQVAIIAILAHMGSFVPAESAQIPVLDRIFTRVGALDNLARGQSTFMVEMVETSQILREATPHSLLVLDEVGRGTSTFDGLSLAWAVVEFLHDLQGVGVKTMFATHYHELIDLANSCPRLRNFNVAVREFKGNIVFMRRLAPGGVSRSYGLQVAKLAGLPPQVISRAQHILSQLEHEKMLGREINRSPQMSLFAAPSHPALDALRNLDISSLTPLQALNLLEELQNGLD